MKRNIATKQIQSLKRRNTMSKTITHGAVAEREIVRAKEGEKMWVLLNYIKADKCGQFEHFVHDILMPAAQRIEPETYYKVRILHPTRQNEDGTFTYVFLMDPLIPDADYSFEYLLHKAYPPEKVEEFLQMEEEAYAFPQVEFEVTQSVW
jgi:hypothetical protein